MKPIIRVENLSKQYSIGSNKTQFPTFRESIVDSFNFLNEGLYRISVFVLTNIIKREAEAEEIISFTVHETGAMRKEYSGHWAGVVRPKLAWQTKQLESLNTRELEGINQ